jgi:hypothetical protein
MLQIPQCVSREIGSRFCLCTTEVTGHRLCGLKAYDLSNVSSGTVDAERTGLPPPLEWAACWRNSISALGQMQGDI